MNPQTQAFLASGSVCIGLMLFVIGAAWIWIKRRGRK